MSKKIRDLWLKLKKKDEVFVVMAQKYFILEQPDEDVDPEEAECVMRVFSSYEDALTYCEATQPFYQEDLLEVASITLNELFHMIDDIMDASMKEFGLPARLDISTMESEDGARSIDTIWSVFKNSTDYSH